MGHLKIYQASAGSGKTYTLALEYILLLFRRHEAFRNILAVTFTNKAAGEMKGRIIEKLFLMSMDEENDYSGKIQKTLNISSQEVIVQSKEILKFILHNYSRFSIQTIDSFFQKIIRSFAMELGLQYSYALQLNDLKVLNAAVDTLLLESNTDEELRKWLILLAESKMNEGKSWNFRNDIFSLGKELFSEKVKIHGSDLYEVLGKDSARKKYLAELTKIVRSFEKTMADIGNKGLHMMQQNSVSVSDFFQKGSGPAAHFKKITLNKEYSPNSYVKKVIEDPEKWVSKSVSNRSELLNIAVNHLQPLLIEAVEMYDSSYFYYNTAKTLISQFYTLGILTDLQKHIQEYSQEQNEFLISDMASFLYRIIDNNDAPFIYEKTGSLFTHYFLDEFQDTSFIQWKNFKPLIDNSLSTGYENLVVGDIKQSIYRWRNSDWKILNKVLYSDFTSFDLIDKKLDANYRSRENIVKFNNTFFSVAPSILQREFNARFDSTLYDENLSSEMMDKINRVYENVIQKDSRPTCKEGGEVRINFFDDGKDDKWKEKVDQEFPAVIFNLLKAGVRPGSISILVRTHKEGKRAVDALMDYRERNDPEGQLAFSIMSNESLYLKNSSSVRFLICLLRYIDNPEDKLNLAELYFEYSGIKQDLTTFEKNTFLTELLRSDIVSAIFTEDEKIELSFLKKLSLAEMLEGAIRLFALGNSAEDVPYLQAFIGEIVDYTRGNPSDILSFLSWWEEEGVNKSLTVPEGSDALQVLTIFKSKGLQFKYVFIPYANWSFDHSGQNQPILWCETDSMPEPFNNLPLVPVKYGSSLIESYFNKEYYSEFLDSIIDNINLLYVAFTRAEDALYVYAQKSDKAISTVAGLLSQTLDLHVEEVKKDADHMLDELPKYWAPGKEKWEFGIVSEVCNEGETKVKESLQLDEYYGWSGFSRMRLKYQGLEFFSEDRAEKIRKGTILHELFEHIMTPNDIEDAVKLLNSQGKINSDEVANYCNQVETIISNPEVSDWFSGNWEVKPEAGILLKSGKTIRPDRVMIKEKEVQVVDYKFGEIQSEGHKNQMKGYMRNLKQMGYSSVRGFLWYVELQIIDEIKFVE